MAFNGSGTFSRLYSWVVDAVNGIYISSTRMDAEMDGFATGLSNCITRDGQSPATADIPMGGKKITGLAAGTLPTDAANVGQIVSSEWVTDATSVAYVSATSLKLLGVDRTAIYTVGRRIKTTNTGGTVYSTVKTSSFSTDTTLTVVNDSGSLDSGISAVSYGLLSYASPSYLDPRSAINYSKAASQSYTSGATKVLLDTASVDTLSEAGSNKITIKYAGNYLVSWFLEHQFSGTGYYMAAHLYKNGSSYSVAGNNSGIVYGASAIVWLSATQVMTLAPGDYLELYASGNGAGSILCTGAGGTRIVVARIS